MTSQQGSSSTCWLEEKNANSTGHFRVSWIPDTKPIIFSLSWCAQKCLEYNVPVLCVCVCVWDTGVCIRMCVWLMYYAVPYNNYIVCLSHTIAVPVFVVPQPLEHARNAMMTSPDFWQKEIYSLTIQTCMCVFRPGLMLIIFSTSKESLTSVWDTAMLTMHAIKWINPQLIQKC